MAGPEPTRRDRILLDAVNPTDGKRCKVQISHDRMLAVARRSMGQAKECAYIVPAVLLNPTAIFEGLRRDEDEDRRGVGWRCYCGSPRAAYRADGTETAPWPDQIFLIFVNEDSVAYNWRWEMTDDADRRLPTNHAQRFRRRLL